ncbi:aromatic ring-hydroxylating dioxygenase subunit alpha [Zhongshania sp.]|uniref:aromatic ring-hydroxylating oxygenase subunit alpha n=1 Tax=Zhongshania sp. TaxID=1971902 RepID=UPI001B60AEE5|nr:aromatic ring-hydroxylating dioxygenase subunit alpha [Zhongshania sp.]MBQ0794888.1 aromatic ring-hydroxylating dioxygenase subunit alpha [Zhongshania sp.]
MNNASELSGDVPLGLTPSQWEAISGLTSHSQTRIPTDEASRPSSVYLSELRFDAEMQAVFRSVPVVATMSAYVQAGMSLAQDCYGVPILITRDKDGVARCFLNACRHRGAKLIESTEPVKSARLSCPYHAWTYAADGKLIGVPRQETFPSIKKCELGLVPLTTYEAGGYIWVGLDPEASPEMLPGSQQICEDLEAFGLQNMHVYGRRLYDLKANWKLVVEPFLEPYHIQRLHADSIAKMFVDAPNVISLIGPHQRQCSGKANFDPAILNGQIDNLHKYITHAYLVFPNTIVVTSPYYISVMVLMPRGVGRTVVDYYMLVKSAPDTEKAKELYARSYRLIDEVFGGEDFRAAQLQQEGLGSGAIDRVYFGGLEEMIGPFHDAVESFLPNEAV